MHVLGTFFCLASFTSVAANLASAASNCWDGAKFTYLACCSHGRNSAKHRCFLGDADGEALTNCCTFKHGPDPSLFFIPEPRRRMLPLDIGDRTLLLEQAASCGRLLPCSL
ncbi:unnamed protein product [Polarella glacialis]|uniref:Secreted protein n=1 Tax=Polarella glacialis TaxID=89957 RepID=A0A813IHY6_POLGL|nr:unnamed protein product [Polarella glacialis]